MFTANLVVAFSVLRLFHCWACVQVVVLGIGLDGQVLGFGLGLDREVFGLGLGLESQVLGLGVEGEVLVNDTGMYECGV